jgi:energy-coupling factor transporter ATP-binding protein EcfA2
MIERGSQWRRWEPHIHAPGTVLNNQFKGDDAWGRYLSSIETATPLIEAIAVTDYYLTDTYEELLSFKASGRLSNAQLIFPNIEVRLDVATSKGGFVNLHLLVSPEDPNHINEVQRLLARLQFRAFDDTFNCTRPELIRLGYAADSNINDDDTAIEYGVNQFKVNFKELQTVISESGWAKDNVLRAVAGGSTDGTAGVREAADKTIRQEIEKFAHIIFASSPAQRNFWLGLKGMNPNQIRERYNGLKPCLHGCDAHDYAKIAAPDGDRYSWIKGELSFDALRQACIDPANRAYVGQEPPSSATPSQVIESIHVDNSSWMTTPNIPLNQGLVAIIGARGSGKTALADMLAAGCDAISPAGWLDTKETSSSFLVRARPLLADAKVNLAWMGGSTSSRSLSGVDANLPSSYPRARYLSQQFVERLCSSNGINDDLLGEMERVIFDSHPLHDREGKLNFKELQEHRASRHRLARKREAETVEQISDRIASDLEKEKLIVQYEQLESQKKKIIEGYTNDRTKLVSKGSEIRAQRHAQLSTASETLQTRIRDFTNQKQTFLGMQDEVENLRINQAPETLRSTKARHVRSNLSDEQWSEFLLDYKGDVDKSLVDYVAWVNSQITLIKGEIVLSIPEGHAYIADDADLTTLSLSVLEAEKERLAKLMSVDVNIQRQFSAISQKISQETSALNVAAENLKDCRGARTRLIENNQHREDSYKRSIEAIIAEEVVLKDLYAPLLLRLEAASGTLQKLSFSVRRVADIKKWAYEAEENLIDMRKQGVFKGAGSLIEKAEEMLKEPWETGSVEDIIASMSEFRSLYQKALLEHAPVARTDQAEFRKWSKLFAHWLFKTDHILIKYNIEYDGVDIRKLSPGTRGIVLLLLYLALDDDDDSPLIIDQPEENLDPKSVYDELVNLFIEAKHKRQVIMVTHNANLVINTDADQIIIAEAASHLHGALPSIKYIAGGLENEIIRKAVCDILEGGETAFQERARRLRVERW